MPVFTPEQISEAVTRFVREMRLAGVKKKQAVAHGAAPIQFGPADPADTVKVEVYDPAVLDRVDGIIAAWPVVELKFDVVKKWETVRVKTSDWSTPSPRDAPVDTAAPFLLFTRHQGGCDYSVACGQKVVPLFAADLAEATVMATAVIFEHRSHHIEQAEIIEVKTVTRIDLEKIYAAEKEELAESQTEREREERRQAYLKLKQEFGPAEEVSDRNWAHFKPGDMKG